MKIFGIDTGCGTSFNDKLYYLVYGLMTRLGFICWGGQGGGGNPGASTTYTSNIPDYARPYVENMMGATQSQLFNTAVNPDTGATEMTGFKPYQPYSTDPNNYVAPFTPMQNQSFQGASNLVTPSQFGTATNMASLSGQGMLGTTGSALGYGSSGAGYGSQGSNLGVFGGAQYGSQGAGYGQQATQAGQNYQNLATSPAAMQAYMSPYMQNVVDYQKGQALRDYQIAAPMRQAAAVGQGAFGGNRLALQQSEAQRGLMSQLQGIEATGAQSAFQNAQAQQQFGANLGLQGLQTGIQGANTGLAGVNAQLAGTAQGMQGAQVGLQGVAGAQAGYQGAIGAANTLGGLGSAQNQATLANLQMQNQFGAQQQAPEQQKINQQIQDYATAQQYPMMQLGMMSNMLRGLPMQGVTTQSYQALPSNINQTIGTLGSLYGASKAFGAKDGGVVKGLAAGGAIKGYSVGGNIKAQLSTMNDAQLQQVLRTSSSDEVRQMAAQILAEHKMAEQVAGQDQGRGLAMASTGDTFDNMATGAGGGIVAFAGGEEVEDPYLKQARLTRQQAGVTGSPYEKYAAALETQGADIPRRKEELKGQLITDYFSNLGTQTGPLAYAALNAAKETTPKFRETTEKINKMGAEQSKAQAELVQADRLERLGLSKEAGDIREKALTRRKDIEVANIHKQGVLGAASRSTDADRRIETFRKAIIASLPESQRAAAEKDPLIAQKAQSQYFSEVGMTGAKLNVTAESKIGAEHKAIDEKYKTPLLMAETDADREAIEAKIQAEKNAVIKRYDTSAPTPTPAAAPAPATGLPLTTPGPGGQTLYLLPNGNYSAVKPKG
jgi:hypothetical protein